MQWIGNQTGARMTFVPFKGGPAATQAFLAGQIQVMYVALGNPGLLGQIKAGKARAVAVSSRGPLLPEVPSLLEVGLPRFGVRTWIGAFAPAGTPREAVAKLGSELSAIVRNQEFQAKNMLPLGLAADGNTPEEFARFIAEDRKDGAELARLLGGRDR